MSVDNRKIAKNTLLLYGRTIVSTFLSIYSSRFILGALGQSDYGLFSVIGSIIFFFSYIKNDIAAATVRYMAFEMERKDIGRLQSIYANVCHIQKLFAILVLVLGETIGLYFVNTHLLIAPERVFAANVVFQVVIFTSVISILQVPYTALILAGEKMNMFSLVGISIAVLHFATAIALTITTTDRLIVYAVLESISACIILLSLVFYCRKHFKEIVKNKNAAIDRSLMRELLSFSGYSMLGSTVGLLRGSGINVLINIVFDTIVNAANGLSMTIYNALMRFVDSVITAVKPQIIKSYAAGKHDEVSSLVVRTTKFAFFLLAMLCLPIITEAEYILTLWLKSYPPYTPLLTRLILVFSLAEVFAQPPAIAINATGKIRRYQLTISFLYALVMPITYVCYKAGMPPQTANIVCIAIAIISIPIRINILCRHVSFDKLSYYKAVVSCAIVAAVCYATATYIQQYADPSFSRLACRTILIVVQLSVSSYYAVLNRDERALLLTKLQQMKDKMMGK